ncbi:MAG: hypothetical protein AB7F86_13140 [Bdellovibrionales bacterium]
MIYKTHVRKLLTLGIVSLVGLPGCQKLRTIAAPRCPEVTLSEEVKKYVDSISCGSAEELAKVDALLKEVTVLKKQLSRLQAEAEHQAVIWQKQYAETYQARGVRQTVLQNAQARIRRIEGERLYESVVAKCARR